jgi:hypothetical protein
MAQGSLVKLSGLFLSALMVFPSCSRKQLPASSSAAASGGQHADPPCIVYKTKADFSTLVPVELSPDKNALVSFPDVKDVYRDGKPVYPTPLAGGFLLDNRGIGPGVAFLKITYEQYHSFDKTPGASDLFSQLLEKDPLLEMYRCGTRYQYQDPVKELSAIILNGKLKDCQKLK